MPGYLLRLAQDALGRFFHPRFLQILGGCAQVVDLAFGLMATVSRRFVFQAAMMRFQPRSGVANRFVDVAAGGLGVRPFAFR